MLKGSTDTELNAIIVSGQNSAAQRAALFEEPFVLKARQINSWPQHIGRPLINAEEIATAYVDDFLNGKDIIANNPEQLLLILWTVMRN